MLLHFLCLRRYLQGAGRPRADPQFPLTNLSKVDKTRTPFKEELTRPTLHLMIIYDDTELQQLLSPDLLAPPPHQPSPALPPLNLRLFKP